MKTGSFAQVSEFSGNGTSLYHDWWVYKVQGQSDRIASIDGPATMNVRVLRHMSGPMINGIYQLAEVQVQIVGDLPIVQSPGCCYSDDTSTEGDTIYGCSFFDVDERGGTYRTGTGPSSEEGHSYYEDCELIMGPLVEFGVS